MCVCHVRRLHEALEITLLRRNIETSSIGGKNARFWKERRVFSLKKTARHRETEASLFRPAQSPQIDSARIFRRVVKAARSCNANNLIKLTAASDVIQRAEITSRLNAALDPYPFCFSAARTYMNFESRDREYANEANDAFFFSTRCDFGYRDIANIFYTFKFAR